MAKIIKNGIEYGGGIPPLGDGLSVNQTTGEIEIDTASDEDINDIVNAVMNVFDN